MNIERHYVVSQQDRLAVRVYRANSKVVSPTLLLCHGFCGIQDLFLPAIASEFARAGYHAVTFDYRGFGESEGEPGRISVEHQIGDIIALLEWCKSQPYMDAKRIALWGTSLGGCHVVAVAARCPQVKCVISQSGFANGDRLVTGEMSADEKARFMQTLERMQRKQSGSGVELMVPIIRVMTDEESRSLFTKMKKQHPALNITIPYLTVLEAIRYNPFIFAAIMTQPVLVVLAENDRVIPIEHGLELYQAITSAKECFIARSARHYDLLSGKHFNAVMEKQLDWLSRNL